MKMTRYIYELSVVWNNCPFYNLNDSHRTIPIKPYRYTLVVTELPLCPQMFALFPFLGSK